MLVRGTPPFRSCFHRGCFLYRLFHQHESMILHCDIKEACVVITDSSSQTLHSFERISCNAAVSFVLSILFISPINFIQLSISYSFTFLCQFWLCGSLTSSCGSAPYSNEGMRRPHRFFFSMSYSFEWHPYEFFSHHSHTRTFI